MLLLKTFIVFVFLFGCGNCTLKQRGKDRGVGGGDGGETNRGGTPPITEESQPQPPVEKPKARKRQFYVNGPLPDAPPLATKEREIRKLKMISAIIRDPAVRSSISGRNRLSESEKTVLLNSHNYYRAQVTNPMASNIVMLVCTN